MSDIEGTTDFRYSEEGAVEGRDPTVSLLVGKWDDEGEALGVVCREVGAGGVEGPSFTVELEPERAVGGRFRRRFGRVYEAAGES